MAQKTYSELARESPAFLKACEAAGVQPTPRQFSKFVRKQGQAWEAHIQNNHNTNTNG